MRIAYLVMLVLASCNGEHKAPPAPAPRPLPWLQMTLDVPADAELAPGKQGDDQAQLAWTGVHLTVTAPTSALLEATPAEALKVAGDVKVTKQATTADGWELRYEDVLAGDTVTDVVILRHIAEANWQCAGIAETPDAAEAIARACATLRPR